MILPAARCAGSVDCRMHGFTGNVAANILVLVISLQNAIILGILPSAAFPSHPELGWTNALGDV